jgi:threonine synthase
MPEIMYTSTNLNSEPASFRQAILKGQAPDKGLYIPDKIPTLSKEEISSMREMTYPEIAFLVASKFLKDELPEEELKRIVEESYNFDVPLEHVFNKNYVMRLDHGPTASFKDFAARMMARIMSYFTKQENKELLILTATSGDTGSAVANAFYSLDNIKVVVLFPRDEVTDRQRRQMTTLGKNITTLAVDGKFDDCQAMVKQAFADPDLKSLNLSSANSINFGRLLPQSVYYFYAYSRLDKQKIIFSVPCGNFGDLTGGLIAKRMGLPVEKFIAAVNENDEFPIFLDTGKYKSIRPSKACISNAMNVGHPSNLARIVAFYGGRMDEKGTIHKMPDMEELRKDIFSVSITDDDTRSTIKEAYEKYKIVLEPHGAVAWAGLEEYLSKNNTDLVCVSFETADPAKFPEEIEKNIGLKPKIPDSLKDLEKKNEYISEIDSGYGKFKSFLIENFK